MSVRCSSHRVHIAQRLHKTMFLSTLLCMSFRGSGGTRTACRAVFHHSYALNTKMLELLLAVPLVGFAYLIFRPKAPTTLLFKGNDFQGIN